MAAHAASDDGVVHQLRTARGTFALRVFGAVDAQGTTAAAAEPHSLVFFIHGAGMSSMSIAACASLLLTGGVPDPSHPLSGGGGGGGSSSGLCTAQQPPLPSHKTTMGSLRAPAGGLPVPPGVPTSAMPGQSPGGGGPLRIRTAALDLRFHGETLAADGRGVEGIDGSPVPEMPMGGRALEAPRRAEHHRGDGEGGAGASSSRDDAALREHPLSADNMLQDIAAAIDSAMATLFAATQRIHLVGHSLGGALAAKVAHHPRVAPRVAGVVVVDVVEGTARAALRTMGTFLDRRPESFKNVDAAVQWFVREGGMRSADGAARVVPSLVFQPAEPHAGTAVYGPVLWRTNLRATAPFWSDWFQGMDDAFIRIPAPKMLLVASVDRLDKDLTIAQMQGKFQFEVLGEMGVGHYVLEDGPSIAAAKISRFVRRIDVLTKKLPPPNMRAVGS